MDEALVPLVELTQTQRDRAVERFELLRPHIEDGVSQTELARVHQMSLSTVQRWVRLYRENGLSGLAPVRSSDRGQVRGLPEELIHLIEGLALQTIRRPLTAIHALASQVAGEYHWPIPSYGQVYRIVHGLPNDLKTLARLGRGVYRETFDLLYRREASTANVIWQADHCTLCIYLITPVAEHLVETER